MNKFIQYSSFLICASLLFLASCSSTPKGALDGPEYTSAYICPMHCEGSGSAEAGTCPVCKMDYVANADKTATETTPVADPHEGHNHHAHDGHDHSGHDH